MSGIVGADGMMQARSASRPLGTAGRAGRCGHLRDGRRQLAKLGSDGAWVSISQNAPFRSLRYNRLIAVSTSSWSEHFRAKFAGHPVKTVGVVAKSPSGSVMRRMGEFVITDSGVEGGVIYAVAPYLRDEIQATGRGTLRLDLAPDRELPRLIKDLSQPRGKKTVATHLQRRAHIEGVKSGLLREIVSKEDFTDPTRLAAAIKSLPLTLVAPRPLEEAISTAGGVDLEALDSRLMIRACRVCFAREKCWIGRLRPGAICSRPVSPVAVSLVQGRSHG